MAVWGRGGLGSGWASTRSSLDHFPPRPGLSQLYPSITEAPGAGLGAPKPTLSDHRERWAAVPIPSSFICHLFSRHTSAVLWLLATNGKQGGSCFGLVSCLDPDTNPLYCRWRFSFAQGEEINHITMAHAVPLSKQERGKQTTKQKENGCHLAGGGGNTSLCLVQSQWSKAFHALKLSHWSTFIMCLMWTASYSS